MSKEFCVNSVVAKLLAEYVNPHDWKALIDELNTHTYVRLQWKILKDLNTTETDPKFSQVVRILFVNTDSVVVQSVEMNCGSTRFGTYKIQFEDWDKVFLQWQDGERRADWESCWRDGCRMYGANV